MRTNLPIITEPLLTHEGGVAERQSPLVELTRAVSTCLLFENTFYESGLGIADQIKELCNKVADSKGGLDAIAKLAVHARIKLHLRHVPLFLARHMARINSSNLKYKGHNYTEKVLVDIIQRPDELSEFLSLYWKDNVDTQGKLKKTLSAQVKRGLGEAFKKFNEYQLAKWNRDNEIKLRDVLFLVHAKPKDVVQEQIWKRLVNNELEIPDTWEVALSAGIDKKETWERLIREKKLGYMALLMNLRNMVSANVDASIVSEALLNGAIKSKALPFRFVTASKHAPMYAQVLSEAMLLSIKNYSLSGTTGLVIDVSGSMDAEISAKSTVKRWEVAGALAILFRETTTNCRVFTFSTSLKEISNIRGLGLIEKIGHSQPHSSTRLKESLAQCQILVPDVDRLVVVTDEQSEDGIINSWAKNGYIVNVAPYEHGISISGGWQRINGWSDRLVDWISYNETGHILDAEITE